MAAVYEDRPRQVVPRWRLFDETLKRGELLPLGKPAAPRFTDEMVAGQLHDWKEKPTLSVASDLVSVAFALGLDQVAIDAAHFVHSIPNAPVAARSIAEFYLRNAGIVVEEASTEEECLNEVSTPGQMVAPYDRRNIITLHSTRELINTYARNPILWCNLALLYTSLGVLEKAERAMKTAVWLAPNNRFVLRAASRFYLHQGEREKAHRILADSSILTRDPWILSAEIATADAMRKSSVWIKHARKILDSEHYSPLHTSEMASALGTLELKAGKMKAGRRLMGISLSEATENSVAQAAWVSRNVVYIDIPGLQRSPEAYAWSAWRQARWSASLAEAEKWLNDQPFSSRPAIHGSFIASTVYEDYAKALTFAGLGLRSNPTDVTLINNFAFASAMLGNVKEADRRIRSAAVKGMKAGDLVAYQATKGLIAFRSGDAELGRSLYKQAIHLARTKRDEGMEIMAKTYLAMEESRIGSPGAIVLRQEAIGLTASRLVDPLGGMLSEQLKRYDSGLKPKSSEPS